MGAGANIHLKVKYDLDKNALSNIKDSIKGLQQDVEKRLGNQPLRKDLQEAEKAARELQSIINSSWNEKLGQ